MTSALPAPLVYSSDDESDLDSFVDISESTVLLGFLLPPESAFNRHHFPSKAGGRPYWLLSHAPTGICSLCGGKFLFLCQVYAPLENFSVAFHRMIHVFYCEGKCQTIRVVRSQLARRNEIYGEEPVCNEDFPNDEIDGLCFVCGFEGSKKCGNCKKISYCSKICQAVDWQEHKGKCGKVNMAWNSSHSSLLPEFEIVIEEEDLSNEVGLDKAKALYEKYKAEPADADFTEAVDEKDDEEPEEEKETKAATKEEKLLEVDRAFELFQSRVAHHPDQVIRYNRFGKPLWPHANNLIAEDSIPACECGSKRVFEMQILPQMLYFLHIDDRAKQSEHPPFDFATLAIYTCATSCQSIPSSTSCYIDEFVYRQPPVSFSL